MTAHALCFVQKQRGIQDSDDEEGETGKDAAAGDEDGDGPADGDGQEDEDEDGESVHSSGRMCDMAAAGTAVLGEATAAVDYDVGNIRTGPGSLPVEGGGWGRMRQLQQANTSLLAEPFCDCTCCSCYCVGGRAFCTAGLESSQRLSAKL